MKEGKVSVTAVLGLLLVGGLALCGIAGYFFFRAAPDIEALNLLDPHAAREFVAGHRDALLGRPRDAR